MQINENEMRLLETAGAITPSFSAFQLPSLHGDIPTVITPESSAHWPVIGLALVEAGIIDPASIPNEATTAERIVYHGLREWFMPLARSIKFLNFDIRLMDGDSVKEQLVAFHSYQIQRAFSGWFCLAIVGTETGYYEMRSKATAMERACPGLFATAFEALESASYITVELFTPCRFTDSMAWQLYDGDTSEIPNDREARKLLKERFDAKGEIDRHLPSVMLELFGDGLCVSIKKKQAKLSARQLRKLSTSSDPTLREVASLTLRLQSEVKRLRAEKRKMPNLDELLILPLYPACSLLYDGDERVTQFVDDELNHAYETGEGTDFLGIEELPKTAAELKSYFENLEQLFRVIKDMDALIPHLADTGPDEN